MSVALPATATSQDTGARYGLLPAFLIAALGLSPVGLGLVHGGYFAGSWLAFAVAVAGLLLAIRFGLGPRHAFFRARLSRGAGIALALFTSFAAWNLLSTLWASDRSAALLESTRVVLYLLVVVLAVTLIQTANQARLALTSYALGSGALAGATLLLLSLSREPAYYFRWIKLTEPIGYYNAEATFLLMPAIAAVYLASTRATSRWLRPPLLVAAVVLIQVTVLTQSRGAFWAFIAGLVAYFVLSPTRARALLWWAPAIGLAAYAFDTLNQVHIDLDADDLRALAVSVDAAARIAAASAAIAAVIGVALTLLDLRLALGHRLAIVARVATAVVFVGLLIMVPVRFPALVHPIAAAESAWDQFKGSASTPSEASEVRILNLDGSRRYELWQVAWHAFAAAPAHGVGADNYAAEWNRERPVAHDVLQPHNLYLRLLAELGIPGLLLFLAGFVSAAGAALLTSFRASTSERALVAAVLSACTVFLVHAAGDWVWHMPAVGVGFFMLFGILIGAGARDPVDAAGLRSDRAETAVASAPPGTEAPAATVSRAAASRLRPTPVAVATVVALITLVLAVPQLVSAGFSERAGSLLAQDEPELSLRAARWAALANPLADRPHLIAARAHLRLGATEAAEEEFRAAIRIDPTDWRAYLAWGDAIAGGGGDPRPLYEDALKLNPLSFEVRSRIE